MVLTFPPHFRFGTSTAAAQIETAFEHDWQGFVASDKTVFNRTTDHELRWREDVAIIASLADNYRMSFQWSKLQREPFAPLDLATVKHYHNLLQSLRDANVEIMLVLHHFSNPRWFSIGGGWGHQNSVAWWLDYVKKIEHEFGHYVSIWNTFNEPNLYITLGALAGLFPPQKNNPIYAWRMLHNLSTAHTHAYDLLKAKTNKPIGISHNCAILEADNLLGKLPARLADWWYMKFVPSWFEKCDYTGLSYYARIGFDPFPVTQVGSPNKLTQRGKLHDDLWEYYPQGLGHCIERYWSMHKKPIIITENGVCSSDDQVRERAIYDYMMELHQCMKQGIDVQGYYHWSTWDNFEWNLGPSCQFGLYSCDPLTKDRAKRPSADVFSSLAFRKKLELPPTYWPHTEPMLVQ